MKLSIRHAAAADLERIHAWIAEDSPTNAADVISRILDAIDYMLLPFPLIGRAGKAPGSRELAVRGLPYIVIYEVDFPRDVLTVLSVKHGAQQR